MAADISWSFTAGAADTSLPSVVSTNPADGDKNVAVNTTIKVTFSEAMEPTNIVFILAQGTNFIPSALSFDSGLRSFTLTPVIALTSNTTYTTTISGATDLAGFPMANYSWSFTTAP